MSPGFVGAISQLRNVSTIYLWVVSAGVLRILISSKANFGSARISDNWSTSRSEERSHQSVLALPRSYLETPIRRARLLPPVGERGCSRDEFGAWSRNRATSNPTNAI